MAKSPKLKTQYTCENCGAVFPKWSGQCGNCGEWNTLVEGITPQTSAAAQRNSTFYAAVGESWVSADEVLEKHQGVEARLSTGIGELDRVFGEGVVFGSVSLIGGQPGIGKSTILTQMLIKILLNNDSLSVLYVAGEESPEQISRRIERILGENAKQKSSVLSRFGLSALTNVDQLIALVSDKRPQILVVDSIQTLYTQDLTGIAGSVGQLREAAVRLVGLAKSQRLPIFLVGHVTKEGDIAGPKVLEHIVDTVIEINGERTSELRTVRSLKNRFGPTDEVGLFRLTGEGAEEVQNPADIFLEETTVGKPGSALAVCLEGTRPVVVEVQALVVSSPLPTPRRVSRGINVSKLHQLLAVLQRHAKLKLYDHDVYVSVVGNMEFKDPGMDLAVAAALLSAHAGKPPGEKTVYCGEIGLLGEVRRVIGLEKRVKEAKRLGYEQVVSAQNLKTIGKLTF